MKPLSTFKILVLVVALIATAHSVAQAQTTFKPKWEGSFGIDPSWIQSTSDDGKYVVGTNKKEVSVLDGETGKPMWSGKFLDIAGIKEANVQSFESGANVLFLVDKKGGKDVLVCIDVKTGKQLWTNADYDEVDLGNMIYLPELNGFGITLKKGLAMLDLQTGKEKWTINGFMGGVARYMYLADSKELLLLNYNVNALKALASGLENQFYCVNGETGTLKWKATFQGAVEIKRYASGSFSFFDWATVGAQKGIGSSNVLVDFYVIKDKIFLVMNGLTVYNLKTGAEIWNVHYDVSLNRGMGGSAQLYGAVADPLVTDKYVYVADFSSTSRAKVIRKYDIETGKQLWETPVEGRKIIIPNLYEDNGVLVTQIGGYVNKQGSESSSSGTTYYSKWEWQGPFGLKGFDAETGKLLWETEKFDDRITNAVIADGKVYVADASMLNAFDPKTGANAWQVETKPAKTGGSQFLLKDGGNIVSLGEKGIASFAASNGKMNYGNKTDDVSVSNSGFYDKNYFLATDDGIAGMNLSNGTVKGMYEYTKGFKYKIIDSGESLFQLGEKKVVRYSVN